MTRGWAHFMMFFFCSICVAEQLLSLSSPFQQCFESFWQIVQQDIIKSRYQMTDGRQTWASMSMQEQRTHCRWKQLSLGARRSLAIDAPVDKQ